jgi:LmbE family N-acetylglucosaminyl deacetylase
MKILVIATHPDDEVLGCGGVIARHADAGDSVHVLVVTRGAPDIYPPAQVEAIRRELAEAHAVLGVTAAHFLDFPAPKLDSIPNHELADAIGGMLHSLQPDTVYLPHRGDVHADHRAVHQAALVAARPAGDARIARLLAYETLSETEWGSPAPSEAFVPTVFADISGHLERKLKAIACYHSQLKEFPHPRSLQAIEALARLRGSTAGFAAAEAFMLIREIL